MEKSDLIRRIETARRGWDELLGRVDDDLVLKPGAEGELSAKDLVAHVTWYEREVVRMLRTRAMDVSGLWALGPDERNAAIHEQARGCPWRTCGPSRRGCSPRSWSSWSCCQRRRIHDASRFTDMPPEWEPWKLIAGNTIWHYPDHTGAIQRLLGREA